METKVSTSLSWVQIGINSMLTGLTDSQEHKTFTVEQGYAKRCALYALSFDLRGMSWIVEASNNLFAFIVSLGGLMTVAYAALIASAVSYRSALVMLLIWLTVLTFIIRLRLKRYAHLNEAIAHYAQEQITICETGMAYRQPSHSPNPFDINSVLNTLGRYETREWTFVEVNRFTVHRTKAGLPTEVELQVGDTFLMLSQFHDKDHLVELLTDHLRVTQKIEELPRLFPIWTRVFLTACGIGVIAIIVWVSNHS